MFISGGEVTNVSVFYFFLKRKFFTIFPLLKVQCSDVAFISLLIYGHVIVKHQIDPTIAGFIKSAGKCRIMKLANSAQLRCQSSSVLSNFHQAKFSQQSDLGNDKMCFQQTM